jgi:hypothetical protein
VNLLLLTSTSVVLQLFLQLKCLEERLLLHRRIVWVLPVVVGLIEVVVVLGRRFRCHRVLP